MRKQVWIAYLVAAICFYFAFRGISFRHIWESLHQASPGPISLALFLYFIDYVLRSKRWSILLAPVKPIPSVQLFGVMLIGFFANNVLPLRMGELVRAHLCGTKFNISRTASLGTILLERLCDALSFLTTSLVASWFIPIPPSMKRGAWLLGGSCIAVIVAILVMHHQEETFRRFLVWSPVPVRWKPKIDNFATHFIHSTSGITQPRFVIEAIAYSLVVWILEGTFLYLLAIAFSVPLTYAGCFFLLFALGLSVTLPQAPGFVGTFELFGTMALSLLGIPKTQGLPMVLAVHGLQFLFISVIGMLALWKEGLSLHSLTSTA